jgi:mannose-1-phosphate guanylyltransferase/phosphomannomutase
MGPGVDGIAAFVRLVGLVARTKLTLSAINARIPEAHVARASVPTPWARRGTVMRTVVEAAGQRIVEASEGVRIRADGGGWVLVVPDEGEAVIRLWAEADSDEAAEALLAQWFAVIEAAVAES